MSGIGWVDFSSDDRARVQEVLAMLKEAGTLDELGIGQVRDAYSDLLFPGFSTIQTNARYFLAIPKMLLDWAEMPRWKRVAKPLGTYLKEAENDLARHLTNNYHTLGESPEGVIGHTVVEKGGVDRRPSSTYWNGLRVFNLVRTDKSLAEFCREWRQSGSDSDAVESEDGSDDADPRFEAEVRRPPGSRGSWPEGLTLTLDEAEAKFLSEHFRTAVGYGDSVAAQLLSTKLTTQAISDEHGAFAAFAAWARSQPKLSVRCRERIASAERFSLAVEGAHIIFNRLIAERLPSEKLERQCVDEFASWNARAVQAQVFCKGADREWLDIAGVAGARVQPKSVAFLHDWNDAMCSSRPQRELDKLVERQANNNKPGRSLLFRLPKKKADWYGMKELNFRWSTARRMLRDVTECQ